MSATPPDADADGTATGAHADAAGADGASGSAASGDARAPGARSGTAAEHTHHLPAGAHVGDRRGLTALGAVTVALALGLAGGLYDVLTGPGLRTVFAACFVLGCGLAALTVHREDLRAAVVMPPLVYVALALIGGAVERTGAPGSFLTRQGLELANALIVNAPVLISATALALVVAVARAVVGQRPAGR